MSQKIGLITGGMGAIGSILASRLKDVGFERVYVIDNYSAGPHNAGVIDDLIYCDISNYEKLGPIVKSIAPTHLFHLAAHFANQNSVDFPVSDAQTNVIGTINIFEAMKQNNALQKFVYASSSCIYGNSIHMSESTVPECFETPYAITKYVGELYMKYYADLHKIPSVAIRIFNTYGPGEAPGRYRNVIPNFIDLALAGMPITITGDGQETRDFTYVKDTADLLLLAAFSEYVGGEIFNGGTGVETSIADLAKMILDLTGSKSKIKYIPRREWDQIPHRKADNKKSREFLGYDPGTTLEIGLPPTIEWIRNWRAVKEQKLGARLPN